MDQYQQYQPLHHMSTAALNPAASAPSHGLGRILGSADDPTVTGATAAAAAIGPYGNMWSHHPHQQHQQHQQQQQQHQQQQHQQHQQQQQQQHGHQDSASLFSDFHQMHQQQHQQQQQQHHHQQQHHQQQHHGQHLHNPMYYGSPGSAQVPQQQQADALHLANSAQSPLHHQQQQQQQHHVMSPQQQAAHLPPHMMMPPPQKSPQVTSPSGSSVHSYVSQSPHTYNENGTTSDDSDDSGLRAAAAVGALKRPSPEPINGLHAIGKLPKIASVAGGPMAGLAQMGAGTVASMASPVAGSGICSPTGAASSGASGKPSAKPKAQRKKKKKDPNEPQKPVSAYALFFRDTQSAIKQQNPNASFGEVSTIVASMWDVLPPDNKDVYKRKTEAAKIEYLKTLAAYRASTVSKGNDPDGSSSPPSSNASSGTPPHMQPQLHGKSPSPLQQLQQQQQQHSPHHGFLQLQQQQQHAMHPHHQQQHMQHMHQQQMLHAGQSMMQPQSQQPRQVPHVSPPPGLGAPAHHHSQMGMHPTANMNHQQHQQPYMQQHMQPQSSLGQHNMHGGYAQHMQQQHQMHTPGGHTPPAAAGHGQTPHRLSPPHQTHAGLHAQHPHLSPYGGLNAPSAYKAPEFQPLAVGHPLQQQSAAAPTAVQPPAQSQSPQTPTNAYANNYSPFDNHRPPQQQPQQSPQQPNGCHAQSPQQPMSNGAYHSHHLAGHMQPHNGANGGPTGDHHVGHSLHQHQLQQHLNGQHHQQQSSPSAGQQHQHQQSGSPSNQPQQNAQQPQPFQPQQQQLQPNGDPQQPNNGDNAPANGGGRPATGNSGLRPAQQCIRVGCTNKAIVCPDWEDEYCSNECVISHCGEVFVGWVSGHQQDPDGADNGGSELEQQQQQHLQPHPMHGQPQPHGVSHHQFKEQATQQQQQQQQQYAPVKVDSA